jgi:class 3 adenylate cyclase
MAAVDVRAGAEAAAARLDAEQVAEDRDDEAGVEMARRVSEAERDHGQPIAQRADEGIGRDPEWLRRVLGRYHHTAGTLCARHEGIVVESRSDAVLTVFGDEDAVQRALRAAAGLVASGARCGIATGEVVAVGRYLVGEPVSSTERLGLAAGSEEIRLDARTWRMVRHAAELGEGGCTISRT